MDKIGGDLMIYNTAIILAGGKSSRMNYQNKSFLKLKNKTFIEKILDELDLYDEKIIISNKPEEYLNLDVKVVKDIIPQCGPLSGVHSGLINAKYEYSLVVACDMPFINKEFVKNILTFATGYDAVIPISNGYIQPLCGVYKKTCLPVIEKNLKKNNHKIREIFKDLNVRYLKDEEINKLSNSEYVFININNPKEYDYYVRGENN
jgi:molybdopterin-guanine dinucleotide biosynthesis protein A